MPAAAVLAILVLTGEAQRPELAALMSAADAVAGAPNVVRLVEAPKVSDAEALRVEHALEIAAVVQLTWRDPERLRARLRLHAARTNRWIDRELQFAPEDSPTERGRTLGFAIASMLPEGDPALQIRAAEGTATTPEPRGPPPLERYAIGASFVGAVGLGGPASGIGGTLRAEALVSERVSIGLGGGARRGDLSEVGAHTLTVRGGGGAGFRLSGAAGTSPLGLTLRADALLLYHAVSRQSSSGEARWQGHLIPGAAVGLEATWSLARALDLVLGGGLEVAFGTVDVTVVAAPPAGGAATIPAVRAVADLGVRLRI
jgi:hypothetical protein